MLEDNNSALQSQHRATTIMVTSGGCRHGASYIVPCIILLLLQYFNVCLGQQIHQHHQIPPPPPPLVPFVPLSHRPFSGQLLGQGNGNGLANNAIIINSGSVANANGHLNTMRRSHHDNRNDTQQLLGAFDPAGTSFTGAVAGAVVNNNNNLTNNPFASPFTADSFGSQLPSQFYFPSPFYPSFVGNGQDNAFSASSIIPSTFPINDFSASTTGAQESLSSPTDSAFNKTKPTNHSGQKSGASGANLGQSKHGKTSFGRRFGELMTNSAKALKQFSQFNSKLLNDIKPSKLLGLSSSSSSSSSSSPAVNNDQQTAASTNKVTIVKPDQQAASAAAAAAAAAAAMASSVFPQNAWFPSAATGSPAQQWQQPIGSMPAYYQQPVFVRTQDLPVATAALNPLSGSSSSSSAPSPTSMTSSSPPFVSNALTSGPLGQAKINNNNNNNNGDLAAFESMFHSTKLPLDGPSMYNPIIKSPNRQQKLPQSSMGSSTTTVFHHYPHTKKPIQEMSTNVGPESDLFTASQTFHGMRVKAPKDYDDNSDDEMASGEQNDESENDNDNDSDRPGSWASNSDNIGGGNTIDPEIFSQLEQASRHRPRPGSWNQDFPAGRPSSSESRYRFNAPKMRSKMPFAEFDDSNSDWYNTFLGSSAKSIPPTRFMHPSLLPNPAMSSFYGTRFGQQKSMEASSFYPTFSRPAATPTYGSMYGGMFGASPAQAYFRSPMMASASTMRPVTAMASPFYSPTASYMMPRYPRAGPSMFNYGYPISGMAYQPTAFMPTTPTNNPYSMAVRAPPSAAYPTAFNPMMAASMSYPVRVAPPHMSPAAATMPAPGMPQPLMPMTPAAFFAQSPFAMRPAFPAAFPGSGLFPARRSMNITRRQDNGGADGSAPSDQALIKRSDELFTMKQTGANNSTTTTINSDKNKSQPIQNNTYYYYYTEGQTHNRTTVPVIITTAVTVPSPTNPSTPPTPATYSVTPAINAIHDNDTTIATNHTELDARNKHNGYTSSHRNSNHNYGADSSGSGNGIVNNHKNSQTAEDIRQFLHLPSLQAYGTREGKSNTVQAKLSDWSPVIKRH